MFPITLNELAGTQSEESLTVSQVGKGTGLRLLHPVVQIHHGQPHGCVTERFKVLVLKTSGRKLRGFKSYRSRQYPQCMRHVSPLFGCGWKQPYLPESSNGRTSVFQTECVGSIPTSGSNKGWHCNNLFTAECR